VATEFGLLQSAFIGGYSAASVVFGYLTTILPPFKVTAAGLLIWIIAIAMCASASSYYVLLGGRILSGVGEASFQAVIPPWIQDNAPREMVGMWLSIFFTAIPVGTAVGFGYGAVVSTALGWRWAYWIEGAMMIPFTIFLFFFNPSPTKSLSRENYELVDNDNDDASLASIRSLSDDESPRSVCGDLGILLSRPVWVLVSLGYGAYAAVMGGLASWGPYCLYNVRMVDSEDKSSLVFGAMVCIAGLVGTPVGGKIYDKLCLGKSLHDQLTLALKMSAGAAFFASLLMFAGTFNFSVEFFVSFVLMGNVIIFTITSPINLAIMESCGDFKLRSFAIGISVVVMHLTGDVPSPTLIGYMIDEFAPQSAPFADRVEGLRTVLRICTLYLQMSTLFWGLAWAISYRQGRHRKDKLSDVTEEDAERYVTDNKVALH
jgi:predicted MFS family arabinose efflux permease